MLVIAHRGASYAAPENTLAAFRTAQELGADGFETDVQLTRDGRMVIHHNYTVDARSNGTGRVCELTEEELRQLDFGSWKGAAFAGERIPTFAECLEMARQFSMVNIELKAPVNRTVPYVEPVARAIRTAGMEDRVRISSFDHSLLREMKSLLPAVRVGALTPRPLAQRASVQLLTKYIPGDKPLGELVPSDLHLPEEDQAIRAALKSPDREPGSVLLERATNLSILYPGASLKEVIARLEAQNDLADYIARLDFPVEYLHCEYRSCLADPGLVERMGRQGVGVTPWTVDEVEDLQAILAMSPDGIITNRPDRLLALLGR